jgi:dTDP-4-dehydrorhamnose 3,5-epimerase
MRFVETPLKDAFLIEVEPKRDERGSFCRLFCEELLKEMGIENFACMQVNISENYLKGTLRGMHAQAAPYLEAKIVYCLKGAVYDVILDLRKNSSTYLQHFGLKLSPDNQSALYVPKGFAHGFLTLKDDSELLYLMSEIYRPGYERGYRFDDPAFGVQWPFPPKIISERDEKHPPFELDYALC